MMKRTLFTLSSMAILSASATAAAPLSCETFRDRLNGNLIAADSTMTPEAPAYRDAGTAPDGSKRLSWSTPNLDGSMTCGPRQQFKEFYVSLAVASKDHFVEQLKRFVATNGAAICATNDATPPACIDAGKALLQAGLQQMGAAFQKKATAPNGLASRMLQPHLKAELTAAPTMITLTLNVDDGAELDATLAPLPPLPEGTAPKP